MSKGIKITIGIIIASVIMGTGAFKLKENNKYQNISLAKDDVIKEDKDVVMLSEKTNIFEEVNNYNIYYGDDFNDELIESMKKYDLVILEPLNVQDRTIVNRLKESGVKVFGYISFGEISSFDKNIISKLKESDYLKIDGKKIRNLGHYVADIRSENYKNTLIKVIQKRIIDDGYDGLFIDTFEYSEILKSEELVDEMTTEVANLLKMINSEYPYLNIILHRAFTGLDKCEERYVDAVLFESMKSLEDEESYEDIVSKIDNFTSQGGVCLSISNSSNQKEIGIQIAKEKGWTHFFRPNADYTKWYEYFNE